MNGQRIGYVRSIELLTSAWPYRYRVTLESSEPKWILRIAVEVEYDHGKRENAPSIDRITRDARGVAAQHLSAFNRKTLN